MYCVNYYMLIIVIVIEFYKGASFTYYKIYYLAISLYKNLMPL
jgi:hypothetical protein